MKRHTIAIVGRPNVGKSTLFNRLAGGRRAITHDRPGVTRDRQFAPATWNGRDFWLVDTGGWTADADDPLTSAIRRQVTLAIDDADVILLVVDARAGVHPADLDLAGLLRPHRERVLVVANKVDDPLTEPYAHLPFHELGLGDPCPVSAGAGKGAGDLLDRTIALLPARDAGPAEEDVIQVAVVGRPNVGKSSIVNRLLGEERSVVASEAGTTRDAIDSPLRYQDRTLNFIDTAGLRRRTKVKDEVEFYSSLRTERAVDRAHVCVLVVDAKDGLHVQDVRVASQAWEQGTGLIVAVNKWDLIDEKDTNTAERGRALVVERAPFLDAAPFLYVSALTGQRVRRLLDLILEVAAERDRRVATAEVNRVLEGLVQRNQPPQQGGQEVKILYGSQIGTAPPTFAIVSNAPEALATSYQRFLSNGFRAAWGFTGVPIRLKFRRKRGAAMNLALALVASYLVGAIPMSWIVARLGAGVDLRSVGSGNLGATNLYRTLGWKFAIPAGLFDMAKGAAPTLLLPGRVGEQAWLPLAIGAAAVVGHVFSVFVRFRGGKGVATAAGVVLALAPIPMLICFAVWAAVVKLTGYVSLGSMLGALVFPISAWIVGVANPWVVPVGIVLAAFIVFNHRANLARLLAGTENRFGRRREA